MPSVTYLRSPVVLPTYMPDVPDKNPMFLERRVYQGSSGKVYPLPFIGRIAAEKTDRAWDAVYLENEFLRVMILPEIGGRIHVGHDKTNGYDFFYHQPVIKPALVGLAGPWLSGGVEFNWPQHHRPTTFLPTDVHLEEHADGSKTVWLSEHDCMQRMKGMHGVCLHPDKAYIELKARIYNRTPHVQTFLWWANVATRVHDQYQSFFPPDVHYVADHAKRAMSEFPLCRGSYYGVDYGARARDAAHPPVGRAPNDLSWYANIPVPTSYMAMGSTGDFLGGYDHARAAGLVHVANHHISPGKKQWTWGNHPFGHAWDRNLTDADEHGEFAPYIELMAGVYTDNQPDFSFLMPGETKTWSQFWYPIQQIGPAQQANVDAALSLHVAGRTAQLGVSPSRRFDAARITLARAGKTLATFTRDLAPGAPFVASVTLPRGTRETDLTLTLRAADGRAILAYSPQPHVPHPIPPPATEPPTPTAVATNDELHLIGLHLEQYRHATRAPEDYWREALRRDPGDARCHNALGRWHACRGEFADAERHFRAALVRLTARNPNPYDGEPSYNLGLALRQLGRDEEAYAAFYKATWNHAWQAAGYHALAEIDCARHDWATALDHLDRTLRVGTDHLRARDLRVVVLRKLGRIAEADTTLRETLALDPLDWWAVHLSGRPLRCDGQVRLDLALDYARAGLLGEALSVLSDFLSEPLAGTAPLVSYYRAWLSDRLGQKTETRRHLRAATVASPDYCFPARLEEIAILTWAGTANPRDARAPYYLGNLLFDRRRHTEAIRHWENSAKLDPTFSIVWRNLGIACFNVRAQPAKARTAYERAFRANPTDARLVYERDQLWKRCGVTPRVRRRELAAHLDLVHQRDDLSLELASLHNQLGAPDKALAILSARKFQPWEGGEGQALAQHVATHLALGRTALARDDATVALRLFEHALSAPENLGEAPHLLANQSAVHFWIGEACAAAHDRPAAQRHWKEAATFKGDFQDSAARTFSEQSYYSALAWNRLGQKARARQLLTQLLAYATRLARQPAKIDYFVTSLPTMLLFNDDLQARQVTTAKLLAAQANFALGRLPAARRLLAELARRDPNHPALTDLRAFLP